MQVPYEENFNMLLGAQNQPRIRGNIYHIIASEDLQNDRPTLPK